MGENLQFQEEDKNRNLLLEKFADASDELLRLKIISTDSFTGEIGEFIACQIFKLNKSIRVNKAVDGVSSSGEKYQIKSKVGGNFSFTTSKINSAAFDFLVIIYFDNFYNPIKVIRIPSKSIKSNIVRITSSNISAYEDISLTNFSLPKKHQEAITSFAVAYNQLLESGITRSRRIVGDIGEFYACLKLNLIISESKNEKGQDAKHANGLTFEIKTRRVYDSNRRISETRRLNNLEGKSADYLIVVTLDREFKCSGMWLVPMQNITNKKSANLLVVNNTPGTLNVISSRVSYLKTGRKFTSFEELQRRPTQVTAKQSIKTIKKINKTEVDDLEIIKDEGRRNYLGPQSKSHTNKSVIIAALIVLFLYLLGLLME